jgi:quercetin dioxygenase-like cupin family protein
MLIGLGAVLVVLVGSALAAAPTITGGTLARRTVGKLVARNDGVTLRRSVGSTDVVVARYGFQPGSSSGWHKHPGIVLVTVKSGSLQVFNHRCKKKIYEKGETFVERGRNHLARDRGNVKAVVVPTFIPTKIPANRLTIPLQAPEVCIIK